MELNNHSPRTVKKVFDEFASGKGYSFSKTVVPVRLAKYGDEELVSRSQAKRLLARIEKFEIVVFDFQGINLIGQAFADEIFRVFKQNNPDIAMLLSNANADVAQMIRRAQNQAKHDGGTTG
jgi:23S rRNA pseudoU1915 N3-methylase RlmH